MGTVTPADAAGDGLSWRVGGKVGQVSRHACLSPRADDEHEQHDQPRARPLLLRALGVGTAKILSSRRVLRSSEGRGLPCDEDRGRELPPQLGPDPSPGGGRSARTRHRTRPQGERVTHSAAEGGPHGVRRAPRRGIPGRESVTPRAEHREQAIPAIERPKRSVGANDPGLESARSGRERVRIELTRAAEGASVAVLKTGQATRPDPLPGSGR